MTSISPSVRRPGVWRLVLTLCVIALWAKAAERVGPAYVPTPSEVLSRLLELTRSGAIGPHVVATLSLAAVGFAYGFIAGATVPVLFAAVPRLGVTFRPYVAASAGLPKYALMPLLVLWLGIDSGPALWLVGLLVFYPLFFGVESGLQRVDRRLVIVVRVMGGGRLTAIRLVAWRAVLPFLSAAVRIAVPRAVSAAIVGDLLVGSMGVGSLIETSYQNLDTTGLFAGVMLAAVLVVAASLASQWIERAVTGRGTALSPTALLA